MEIETGNRFGRHQTPRTNCIGHDVLWSHRVMAGDHGLVLAGQCIPNPAGNTAEEEILRMSETDIMDGLQCFLTDLRT